MYGGLSLRHIIVFYFAKSVPYDELTNFTPTNTPTSGVDFAGVLWNSLAIILSSPIPHLTRRYAICGLCPSRAHARAGGFASSV